MSTPLDDLIDDLIAEWTAPLPHDLGFPGPVADKCAELGLKHWSMAIPRDWEAQTQRMTGINPYKHVVWCWDGDVAGYPVAITPKGKAALMLLGGVSGQSDSGW